MATIKVKGLKEVEKRLKLNARIAVRKALRSKELRAKVGVIIENDIRDNFDKTAATSTIKTRKLLEKYNKTHPKYQRPKINITFTGELLEDLAKNVKADTINLALIIEHSDKKHSVYRTKSATSPNFKLTSEGRKAKGVEKKQTHKEISGYLQDKGFDYLKISSKSQKEIVTLMREEILKEIARV